MTTPNAPTRERPILFSGPMVRAILAGHKTQTRRVINPRLIVTRGDFRFLGTDALKRIHCPYGAPGDRLWVRETWQEFFEDELPGRARGPRGRMGIPAEPGRLSYVYYRADGEVSPHLTFGAALWRPSIHMPRWASRLTLEVTEVRVQRLQDISEEDATAEGACVSHAGEPHPPWYRGSVAANSYVANARTCFGGLWNSINAKRGHSWDSNPFVWVITYKVVA